jgi:SAM-dependent methyltransferase
MPPPSPSLPPVFRRLPRREHHEEILDGGEVTGPDLVRSLGAMAMVNRRLGGVRALRGALRELRAPGEPRLEPLTLLDVGTGNGNLARALATTLRRGGRAVRAVGIDLHQSVLEAAQAAGPDAEGVSGRKRAPLRLVRADGLHLPFADGSVDVVTSSLTLHHLTDGEVRALLAEAARVARRRVLLTDLERHPLHYAGARLLGLTVWRRDPITRIDGPLSVLRSFTRSELEGLAEDAPFRSVRIHRSFPFRLVLDGVPG